MKIKDLLTKIALCIVPVALLVIADNLSWKISDGEPSFSLSFIYTFNVSTTCIYIFIQRNKLLNGDEKLKFLGKRADLLLIISQICLGIILYLFYVKFWGIVTLSEIYIFIAVMLYGNYYSLSPMPLENVSIYFEDEDIWRKVSKLRGRLIFTFGLIGLFSVIYYSPNGLGIEYMFLLIIVMIVVFGITYFYAKQQYNRKFDS
jgi:hypothetical protein